jgi:hypothetical protein
LFNKLSKYLLVEKANLYKIDKFICRYLSDKEGYGKYKEVVLDDQTVVTEILLQYEGLNLIERFWSKDKRNLLWGLTDKGIKIMKDMTLVRKKDQ